MNIAILLDSGGGEFLGLLALLMIGGIFYIFHLIGKGLISAASYAIKVKNRLELTTAVMSRYHDHLRGFTYYEKLDDADRKKFIIRLAEFRGTKEFIGAEGLEVTEHMEVLISAAATQLMFGLPFYTLDIFHTIRVHPGIFYSKLMNVHMKGGTTRGGVIMFSWKDFELGYKDGTDKLNLGLHEMAHALKIEAVSGDEYEGDFSKRMDQWDMLTHTVMEEVREGKVPFLRKYAGTNAQEFWAVCVEHFFEAPRDFSQQLPQIYKWMCILLNQDPLLIKERPKPDFVSLPVPEVIGEKVLVQGQSMASRPTFPADVTWWGCSLLFIITSAALYGLMENTLMTSAAFFSTLACFILVGLVIFYRAWSRGRISTALYGMQSLVLTGMIGTSVFLILNMKIATALEPEVYRLGAAEPNYSGKNIMSYTYELEGNAYSDFKVARTYGARRNHQYVVLYLSRGVFGIKVFHDYMLKD